jgi:hypothetical protein
MNKACAILVVSIAAGLMAGAASAEPKNQPPFTRPIDARSLTQGVQHQQTIDLPARPEAKNEWPFTRPMGTATGSSSVTPSAASGGIDWTLTGWGALVAVTFVGGGVAVSQLRAVRRTPA